MKLEQAARALLAHWDTPAWKYLKPTGELMADLREALAEQVHTPYCKQAPMCKTPCGNSDCVEQAKQEPVACDESCQYDDGICLKHRNTVKHMVKGVDSTIAPVRTKDLTDDEINNVMEPNMSLFEFARAVIAADREKNRGTA